MFCVSSFGTLCELLTIGELIICFLILFCLVFSMVLAKSWLFTSFVKNKFDSCFAVVQFLPALDIQNWIGLHSVRLPILTNMIIFNGWCCSLKFFLCQLFMVPSERLYHKVIKDEFSLECEKHYPTPSESSCLFMY